MASSGQTVVVGKLFKGKEITDRHGNLMFKNQLQVSLLSSKKKFATVKKNYLLGNYYPITTDISLSDPAVGTEVAVIIDRAQGGSSMQDGQLELMVHRRLLHDDAFGVGEALNETAYGVGLVARGKHWVITGGVEDAEWLKQKQLLKQEKILDCLIALRDAGDLDFDTWSKSYNSDFSGLTNPLPDTVQILTLEPWKGKTYLIRLEHILEKKLTQDPVTVNLDNLFTTFDIVDCRETTLGKFKREI